MGSFFAKISLGARFLALFLSDIISYSILMARFWACSFSTTALAQCLVHIFVGYFIATTCLTYGFLYVFWRLSLQKPLLYTLVHVSCACSFTTTSLAHSLVHVFWASFFAITSLAHCLEHVFWSYFFQIISLIHCLWHVLWVCEFATTSLIRGLVHMFCAYFFAITYLTIWCTFFGRLSSQKPIWYTLMHVS